MDRVRIPVIMLAGIERDSETAVDRSASHYRRRRALFDPEQPFRLAQLQWLLLSIQPPLYLPRIGGA
jgi:hypothetical protein